MANPFTEAQAAAAAAASAPSPAIDRAAIVQSDPVIVSGAGWFWWIVGLSLVNTVLIHSGSDTSFVVGLGFTTVADAMFREMKVVAFILDAIALGTFVALGLLSRKGHLWAFITGIVLYGLDALIYLAFQDWMPVAFHAFALFYMVRGAAALRAGLKAAAEPPPVLVPSPEPVPVRVVSKP